MPQQGSMTVSPSRGLTILNEEFNHGERCEELRSFAALESIGKVVKDELIKIATGGLDEGKILESIADGDNGPHMIQTLPFNSIAAKNFLILSFRFGSEAFQAFDEILDWLGIECMKNRFRVCDEKLQLLVRVFLIALFVKDFECEGLNEDLIAALIDKPGPVEGT